jgi:hypothetical protein
MCLGLLAPVKSKGRPAETKKPRNLDELPPELKRCVLHRLQYEEICQLKSLSKDWKRFIESDEFSHGSTTTPKLTACYFFIKNGVWQWAGFESGKWRRMPHLTFLPANCDPDPDLFKQFLVCAKNGLVCMNFSKSQHEERVIVFNPLSRRWKELPPLLHRRNPVLMHMIVDEATHSYQILVAGSSSASDEQLSRITEVYDSRTGRWTREGDLPGPAFALNDYQAGVLQNGNLFCIGFMELDDQVVKGILGFNMAKRAWSTKWTDRALTSSPILQLVENYGDLYLFSEREIGRITEHWVDRVEWNQNEGDTSFELINVIKKNKDGGRSLEVYPEFALVPSTERRLCIFNTVDHTGDIYELENCDECEALPTLPRNGFRGELGFFSLNPLTFVLEPSFCIQV